MRLNSTQLRILELIAINNKVKSKDITFITKSLVSAYLNQLLEQGFLEKLKNEFTISSNRFARILSNLLIEDSTLKKILVNEGIPILMILSNRENQTLEDISRELGLNKSSIYPYIRNLLSRQIVNKEGRSIIFNENLWNNLFQFISLYKNNYVLSQFKKVPNNAKIYYESPYEIVFSLATDFKDANKTAFSLFNKFGIPLMEKEIFYRLDDCARKKLNVRTILLDALRIAGLSNEVSIRRRIYSYLFYKKNINQLRKIKHPDLEILKKIVENKGNFNDKDYPSYREIEQKGEDYDIQI
jgi:predicted transcriptional regulator